jgi:hypothetical protein
MKFGPRADDEGQPRSRHAGAYRPALHSLRARCSKRSSGSRWARSSGRTVLYPLARRALARVRTRRVRKEAIEPTVTVIVAAYNEEPVIERRLENLLALDYPPTGSRSSSPPTRRPTARRARRARGASRVRLIATRAAARSPRRTARCARAQPRSSPSPTRTRRGRRMRCGVSSRTSPTRTWPTSAAAYGSRMLRGRTARASTGATSSGCASRNPASARSPAATARSTP